MRTYYADHQRVELPVAHRFPMGKYAEIRMRLLDEGVVAASEMRPAPPIPREALLRVHDAAYVDGVLEGTLSPAQIKRIGFPWSPALVRRTLASSGGTFAAAEHALTHGAAGVLAGGTHHALRETGAGYCIFNDIAVAAQTLLDTGRARQVLVVDVDVHQGDGTAAIFEDDARVFTCSLHGAKNFPSRKQRSDLDVPLPDDTGDVAYLAALEEALAHCFEAVSPDIVFVQSGVDALASDRLGRLALSHEGMRRRDEAIFARTVERRIPTVVALGGGYAEPIEDSIAAHVATFRALREGIARRRTLDAAVE